MKATKPHRSYLDSADQIGALLDAAAELDAVAQSHPQIEKRLVARRAILATLIFAGLRIGELLDLRWRDVDLASGRLRIKQTVGETAKTDAGHRDVTLLPALRDVLTRLKADRLGVEPDSYVFGTARGGRQSESNVRQRVLAPAVERANAALVAAGVAPLPDGLTPHGLRRTFASLLYATGTDPRTVMAEMGHTNEGLALRIYAQAIRRDAASREQLRALVEGVELAIWANEQRARIARKRNPLLSTGKTPARRRLSEERLKGLEPSTFCMASRRSSQLSYSRERDEYNPAPPFKRPARARRSGACDQQP